MDILRSAFPVEYPRLHLDAGTYATMGAGLSYAIAAHFTCKVPSLEALSDPSSFQKKIVCLEGDFAFGFSLAEGETMSRYVLDTMILVIINGVVYRGDSEDSDARLQMQQKTIQEIPKGGLGSSTFGWEVSCEKIAEMWGGKGYLIRRPEEPARAAEESFKAKIPAVVNVIIESGKAQKLVSKSLLPLFVQDKCDVDRVVNSLAWNSLGKTIRRKQEARSQALSG